eukprot:m.78751 g.78751  ORF g.78751 m.78751 type:complete len:339 (-) comp14123_c0_seq2:251-1267(-)
MRIRHLFLVVVWIGIASFHQSVQAGNNGNQHNTTTTLGGVKTTCALPRRDPVSLSDILYEQGYVWLRNVSAISNSTTRGTAIKPTRCVVSRRFKFVFHHVLKNGGSTVTMLLKLAIGGVIPGHAVGDPYPEKAGQLPFSRRGDDWLLLTSCNRVSDLADYIHFTFVRDPYSRLRSVHAFAQSWRLPSETYPRPPLSLLELAQAPDPVEAFRGTTKMGSEHAEAQHAVLLTPENTWTVDFVADIGHISEAFLDHLIPVLTVRAQRRGVDTQPLKKLAEYFALGARKNAMVKPDVDKQEAKLIKCILYTGYYRRDYEVFFVRHEEEAAKRARLSNKAITS